MLYIMFKIINIETLIGVSNLKYEIQEVNPILMWENI